MMAKEFQIREGTMRSDKIFKLDEIFDEIARQMQSDFQKASKATKHPGLRGNAVEIAFRKFLCEYLPASLDISTGIIVDSEGNSSQQLDVIISDAAKTPTFYKDENTRVIPIECAYTVIEVKKYLNSNELDDSLQKMKSVRSLKKRAYFHPMSMSMPSVNLYGQEWEIWPVNYFIFAANSILLENLTDILHEKHQAEQLPVWSRIDTVCT
jgi:hypothetical protein